MVNFELPNAAEDYIHRIGRTGRAGMEGQAVSLVCVDEHKLLKDIEKLLKQNVEKVVIPGYEPDPTIKAVPVNKGRQQQRSPKNGTKPSRQRNASRNKSKPVSGQRPAAQNKSRKQRSRVA